MGDIRHRILERAALSRLDVPEGLLSRLVAYYDLLTRWNEKINLTSLADRDEAVDRLLLEPLAAARSLKNAVQVIDLGSGGGSPAIPIAFACSASRLVMVESRERKGAFLREAIRQLDLSEMASVETSRFEALSGRDGFATAFDVVTIRAVRLSADLLTLAGGFLRRGGTLALFRGPTGPDEPEGLPDDVRLVSTTRLLRQSGARLTVVRKK